MTFVLLIGTMFLNLIIAIFAASVAFISQHQHIYNYVSDIMIVNSHSPRLLYYVIGQLWCHKKKQDEKIYIECYNLGND